MERTNRKFIPLNVGVIYTETGFRPFINTGTTSIVVSRIVVTGIASLNDPEVSARKEYNLLLLLKRR